MVGWKVEVVHGVDGIEQEQINQRSRWVSTSAIEHWTEGAIASALSHIKAWRRCIELNQGVLVVEDDAILANDLEHKLEELKIVGAKENQRSLVLLGWNPDYYFRQNLCRGSK